MSLPEDPSGEEKKSANVDGAGDETNDEEGDEVKIDGEEAKDDATGDAEAVRSGSKKSGTDVDKGKSQAGEQSSIGSSPRGSLDKGGEKKSESKRRSSTASGGSQKRPSQQEGEGTSVDTSPARFESDKTKKSEPKIGRSGKSAAKSAAASRDSDGRKTTSRKTKASEAETSRKKSSPRTSNLSDIEDYPRDSDERPTKLNTRKTEAPRGKNRQPRRYSARSAEPQSMVVGRIRKAGPDVYAENRKRLQRGESEIDDEDEDKDKRQHISMLSQHTMEELSEKPKTFLTPTSTTSMLGRKKVPSKSYGSKLMNVDEFKLGGTRMSTLTDFLRRKQVGSRMRAMSREMQALRDQVHPDGRPTLYEEYCRLSEQRIHDLAQHFTPEQMMEYRDAFYNFDDDLDGFIPIGEVPYLMRALCQNPTEEELYDWISQVDIDALGSIDFADFLTIMHKKKECNPIGFEEVMEAFRVFDNHDNGLLCAKELVYLMTTFGETLSEEEMEDMLREVSINDDYEVSYEEFVKKMTEC